MASEYSDEQDVVSEQRINCKAFSEAARDVQLADELVQIAMQETLEWQAELIRVVASSANWIYKSALVAEYFSFLAQSIAPVVGYPSISDLIDRVEFDGRDDCTASQPIEFVAKHFSDLDTIEKTILVRPSAILGLPDDRVQGGAGARIRKQQSQLLGQLFRAAAYRWEYSVALEHCSTAYLAHVYAMECLGRVEDLYTQTFEFLSHASLHKSTVSPEDYETKWQFALLDCKIVPSGIRKPLGASVQASPEIGIMHKNAIANYINKIVLSSQSV